MKDEATVKLRPDPPRTTRLFDFDWDDPWVLRIAFGVVGILVLAFIKAVS